MSLKVNNDAPKSYPTHQKQTTAHHGETLRRIGDRTKVPVDQLQKLNPRLGKDPDAPVLTSTIIMLPEDAKPEPAKRALPKELQKDPSVLIPEETKRALEAAQTAEAKKTETASHGTAHSAPAAESEFRQLPKKPTVDSGRGSASADAALVRLHMEGSERPAGPPSSGEPMARLGSAPAVTLNSPNEHSFPLRYGPSIKSLGHCAFASLSIRPRPSPIQERDSRFRRSAPIPSSLSAM